MHSKLLIIACVAGLAALDACAPPPPPPVGVVYVRSGPPAEVVETVPAQPSPDHVWIRGHYRWDGVAGAYVWVPGHWQVPPQGYRVWVPARWVERHGEWYFIEGHWRS